MPLSEESGRPRAPYRMMVGYRFRYRFEEAETQFFPCISMLWKKYFCVPPTSTKRQNPNRQRLGFFLGFSPKREIPDPAMLKCAGVAWLRVEPWQCGLKALEFSASGGAAAVRESGASPDSAVHGSNRRAQAIHGLLAPDPRTAASFAT